MQVAPDAAQAARLAAELVVDAAESAIAERGTFSFAVSGGRGPWRMFELIGDHDLDWSRIELFQVDERVAPNGNPDRNLTHLLASAPASALERIRPMAVTDADLDAAAARYAQLLPERLDLVHLGLGPDGHTASLVPGDQVLEVDDRLVAITGVYQGRERMTLTYPALAAARRIFWLVTGADKCDALAKLRAGDRSIPAGRVQACDASVVADAEAAGEVPAEGQ